ncbi:MAG: exonuclease domain-containing protein [Ornithinibacter sp.]
MSLFRRTPEQRRERAARAAAPGPLADYLSVPLPDLATALSDLRLLAVDIETTGLDPRRDRVLSIGWLPVDGGRIELGGAGQVVVRDAGGAAGVGQSATVHGLTDDRLAGGEPLEDAVARLLAALAGRALLAHFARIETQFLAAVCERAWGAGMPCVVVDTFELERRVVAGGWGAEPERGALRLWTARERRGLPVYRAHEALTDALACAELYLAQRAELEAQTPQTTLTLRHVVA